MVANRLCIAAVVSMAAAACQAPVSSAPPARVSSAPVVAKPVKPPVATRPAATQSIPPDAEDEDGPSGVLVVSADIVHRCANLQAIKNGPPPKDEESAWLIILQSLADCMKTGGLKGEHLVVTGGSRPGGVVRYVLAKLGIANERVETIVSSRPDEDCDLEEDCGTFSVRIDVAPRKNGTQQL